MAQNASSTEQDQEQEQEVPFQVLNFPEHGFASCRASSPHLLNELVCSPCLKVCSCHLCFPQTIIIKAKHLLLESLCARRPSMPPKVEAIVL